MGETRVGAGPSPAAWAWIAFIVLFGLGLSRAFACITPFAAVATAAAHTLPRRHAWRPVVLVWLGNQSVGFGLLHYPATASTFGWGAAIGVAALAALAAADGARRWATGGGIVAASVALLAALAAYEAVLVATACLLPSGSAAFSPTVMLRVFGIDAVALGLLLAADGLARAAGWAPRARMAPGG